MKEENIFKNIVELLKKDFPLLCLNKDFTINTNLISDLVFDSISIMQLIIKLETIFEIEFDDEFFDSNNFCLENIVKFIGNKNG